MPHVPTLDELPASGCKPSQFPGREKQYKKRIHCPVFHFSPRTTKTIFQKAGSKNPPIPKKKRAHTSATRYFVPALDRPRRQNRTRLSQHDALNTHPHCLTLGHLC